MSSLSNKSDLVKGLKNGKGLSYLLKEAYKILGNPMLIHDMEYKVIDFNQNVITDDPIWIEYIATGTVGYNWLDFFKNECFLDDAANTKSITILTSDKLKYNRIFGKLFNKNNIQIGCACMVACDKPFEYDDPKLFEDVCAVFSAEFGRIEFYSNYGQAYLEKLMGELIAGVKDRELYTAHVESIYMHLKTNLYLAVADIGKCGDESARPGYFRNLFKKAQPEYTYAVYNNYILIIIGTDDPVLYIEKDLKRLNQFFQKNNIYAGVSSNFDNLFELQKYYEEAKNVLTNNIGNGNQRIFLYEDK